MSSWNFILGWKPLGNLLIRCKVTAEAPLPSPRKWYQEHDIDFKIKHNIFILSRIIINPYSRKKQNQIKKKFTQSSNSVCTIQ